MTLSYIMRMNAYYRTGVLKYILNISPFIILRLHALL